MQLTKRALLLMALSLSAFAEDKPPVVPSNLKILAQEAKIRVLEKQNEISSYQAQMFKALYDLNALITAQQVADNNLALACGPGYQITYKPDSPLPNCEKNPSPTK